MAEERQSIPPARKPISLTSTPVHTDSLYIEVVNKDDPAYIANAPIKRGTLYSTIAGAKQEVIDQYPLLYFAQETQLGNSDQWVQWRWITDPLAEDTYNAEISYALESVTSPTYARTYTIRRDVYDNLSPIAMGTPLTGIIGVHIVNAGQDYTHAEGTIDTDATIEFVIAPDGTIIAGIVTDEGSGVTSGGQITITGDGAGGEATAIIQSATAVLIGQKKQEFPPDHPLNEEYVRVTRIYQTLPGPTIHSTQLHVDGVVVDVATTQKVAASITSGESLNGGVWTMTTKTQEDNAYVGKEIVSTRAVPGNPIKSTTISPDGDIITETRTLVEGPPTLVTTITTIGGVWTKTFGQPLTERLTFGEEASDLVSWEIVQVKATQSPSDSYEVSIPDLLPQEFAATLPITTHEDTHIGFASLPVLAVGDLMRRQAQIDYNTYRLTVRGRASISLPQEITNKEITNEFGGGEVNRTATLDLYDNLTLDEGLTVLTSEIQKLDSQTNGLAVKTTRQLNGDTWPILPSRLWDENTRQEYDQTEQLVALGTPEDPNPGVFGWVSEVKGIDWQRARKVNTSKSTPQYVDKESALISYEMKPYEYPGYVVNSGSGWYVKQAHAKLILHTIRTWWVSSVTTPTTGPTGGGFDVEYDPILCDDIIINNLSNTGITYAQNVLHDDFTWGTLSFPATTPSATQYYLGTPTGTVNYNIASLYSPGSAGGYIVGDTITIAAGGFTMQVDVTFVYDVPGGATGLIGTTTALDLSGTYPVGNYGPIAASGGSGTGAFFNVWSVDVPTYTPGTQWIGNEHVIGAAVTPEKEKDVWRVVTESVTMH